MAQANPFRVNCGKAHPKTEPCSRLLFGSVAVVLALLSIPTRADASNWTLNWDAPWRCPSERAVRNTVRSWLEQSVEPKDTHGIRVQATVHKSSAGFALDLTLVTPTTSSREQLAAARCETLAGVVALKVALLANPGALSTALAAEPSPPRDQHWGVRLAAALGPGSLPGLGPFLELATSRRFSYSALELGVGYGFSNGVRYDGLQVGAKFDLLYVRPRVCALPDLTVVEFPICAGMDLGMMRGRGFGSDLTEAFSTTRLYGAVALGAALRWPKSGWLAGWLGTEALVPVIRPDFHARNLDRLYKPERVGARVQLGIEARLR